MFKIEQRKYRTEVETNFFALPLLAYNALYFVALLFFLELLLGLCFQKNNNKREREREKSIQQFRMIGRNDNSNENTPQFRACS